MNGKPVRRYEVHGEGGGRPPNFDRIMASLSDEDLEAEILGGKGELNYRLALLAEDTRRAHAANSPDER